MNKVWTSGALYLYRVLRGIIAANVSIFSVPPVEAEVGGV